MKEGKSESTLTEVVVWVGDNREVVGWPCRCHCC